MVENTSRYQWIEVDLKDEYEMGCGKELSIPITVRNIQGKKRSFTLSLSMSFEQKDSQMEWLVSTDLSKGDNYSLSPRDNRKISEQFDVDGNRQKEIAVKVSTPRGGYIGDSSTISLSVSSDDGIHSFSREARINLKPVIVAMKTTLGSELSVAIDLENRAIRDYEDRAATNPLATSEVISIMFSPEVKGYVFVETMHPDRVFYLARGIKNYKGMVEGEIRAEEILHYLTPKPAVSGLELGAFVELIDGPFKGEKAKIMSIDTAKEEVTVQLIESMVPIPVTVRAEAIRMLEKK
ncbi:hypothetical protein GCM10007108_06640 [Thermogymnomonas acidicola]|uniref:Transcription elongation factor Spt5 n=1 Tax=Thermogymnomonas acidicola TaxID=399579 RepID=A0AA37BQQ3_9ARCH|nr:transcription elongation factor Spt5 [Thermogymnomonas acidicola]GGM71211.1 hypothetical protein GCM10007108_06640 [Thermogymnomonas acidicola]